MALPRVAPVMPSSRINRARTNSGITLRSMAIFEAALGRYEIAIGHLQEARAIFEERSSMLDTTMALNCLGDDPGTHERTKRRSSWRVSRAACSRRPVPTRAGTGCRAARRPRASRGRVRRRTGTVHPLVRSRKGGSGGGTGGARPEGPQVSRPPVRALPPPSSGRSAGAIRRPSPTPPGPRQHDPPRRGRYRAR